MKRCVRRLPELILAVCLLFAALRLVFRDRFPILSTLTYATPLILLAVAAAVGAGTALAVRRWKWAAAGGVIATVFFGGFIGSSWFGNAQESGGDFRVLVWNVSRGSRGWDRVAGHVREASPDVAIFVESGQENPDRNEFLRQVLTGCESRWLEGGLGIVVRGTVLESSSHRLGEGGRAAVVRAQVAGRAFTVVIVDISADPWRHRREAFEALHGLLAPLHRETLLVAGDFNTPRDSVFFDRMRGGLHHAFEKAGRGFDSTWPHPLPVLAIDHLWFGPGWRIRECRLQGSSASDHRSVLADFGR